MNKQDSQCSRAEDVTSGEGIFLFITILQQIKQKLPVIHSHIGHYRLNSSQWWMVLVVVLFICLLDPGRLLHNKS